MDLNSGRPPGRRSHARRVRGFGMTGARPFELLPQRPPRSNPTAPILGIENAFLPNNLCRKQVARGREFIQPWNPTQNSYIERFNLERPDLIRQLHFEYLQADAQGQPVREEAHACRSSAIVTMRDQKGRPLAAIPATADADPSYHTGLSLIDTIEIVKSFT